MRYFIEGLDGVEREVTKFEYNLELWLWRSLGIVCMGALLFMLWVLVSILSEFLSFNG